MLQKLEYSFDLNRKSFYYILKIILPVIFLVYLSFMVFLIPSRELESKLAVSLGSLLTLVVFQFTFGDDVPKINDFTVLDTMILASYLFTGISTFITIINHVFYSRSKEITTHQNYDKNLFVILCLTYPVVTTLFALNVYN